MLSASGICLPKDKKIGRLGFEELGDLHYPAWGGLETTNFPIHNGRRAATNPFGQLGAGVPHRGAPDHKDVTREGFLTMNQLWH
jgi:hypothetical protein